MKKFGCILCTGCPESEIDSAKAQTFLRKNGWNITKNFKNADLILFRACGLTEKSAEESLNIIRRIKTEKKKNVEFIVWGCLPKIDPETLKTEYAGVTFGENEVSVLNKLLTAKKPIDEIAANYLNPIAKRSNLNVTLDKLFGLLYKPFTNPKSVSIFYIKASTGCLGNCSFCAINKSRGPIKSKRIDSILSEFRTGLDMGFKYFTLLGTDLGAYGMDLGNNLVDLLAKIITIEGDYEIYLRNVNPYYLNEMFEELKPIFSSGKIWFLLSAVESGSDRILKLMNRKYKI